MKKKLMIALASLAVIGAVMAGFLHRSREKQWGDFQAGEKLWVVNAPQQAYRGGQRPPRNGFSDSGTVGRFAGGGVALWVTEGGFP